MSDIVENNYNEEYDAEYMEIQDFMQDAEAWYEEEMELRDEQRQKLNPTQFKQWEAKRASKKTNLECRYEIYLRTGNVILKPIGIN
ncbi:MAG: hypothetical protein RLZ10_689 [Bacteroidota bacterium]|jgi:alpha-galactosidase/6-phospho-beta-glucosidase family protein